MNKIFRHFPGAETNKKMKAKKRVFNPEMREEIRTFITDMISRGAAYNSIDFILDSLADDIKSLRESPDLSRKAETETAIAWCEELCKHIARLRGKYNSVKNPYDEGLAACNVLAQIRIDLLERSTSKEFHRNNSPDGKTPRSSPNINYELCIAITSAAINNLYRQIDAAVNLHNMNILLGFYDDIQNDRITPHLTGWGGSPAGEPETR
nr:MAG TPA: hypothetical protein [Caudoviricetes sp.]